MLVRQTHENTQELLRSKKLLLILDIDHTVLHASCDSRFKEVFLPWFWEKTSEFSRYPEVERKFRTSQKR